ncbi:MAG: NAD-binding protein [Mycoplasmoidaceae bacterium]
MKNNQRTKYLIIGYGKFGKGFVTRLLKEGIKKSDIFINDLDGEVISKLSADGFNNVVKAKITELKQLESHFPLDDMDIILIGTADLEISISLAYSWANHPEYEEKTIYAKAGDELHKKLLKIVGINANNIVIPEEEVGSKMALKSFFNSSTNIEDITEDFSIVHLVLANKRLNGVTINELGALWKEKYENRNWNIIIILGIDGKSRMALPNEKIYVGDKLSIGSSKVDRRKLYSFLTKNK